MKTRLLSTLSLAFSLPLMMTVSGSAVVMGGCGGDSGGGGTGGFTPDSNNLISSFEDSIATVVMAGTPTRNGYWYTYNDTTCMQTPIPDPQATMTGVPLVPFVPEAPAMPAPAWSTGGLALHAKWSMCTMWGGGVGADLAQPAQADGGTYMGPKVPYDATPYKGVRFWARAENMPVMSNGNFRVKFPMVENTKVVDGGTCTATETGSDKCSDDWGFGFALPNTGAWKEVVVDFSSNAFKQEGWGKVFPWAANHMTSIQIQNAGPEFASNFDLWVDDIYFY
jgi:hypothetical protein